MTEDVHIAVFQYPRSSDRLFNKVHIKCVIMQLSLFQYPRSSDRLFNSDCRLVALAGLVLSVSSEFGSSIQRVEFMPNASTPFVFQYPRSSDRLFNRAAQPGTSHLMSTFSILGVRIVYSTRSVSLVNFPAINFQYPRSSDRLFNCSHAAARCRALALSVSSEFGSSIQPR